VFVEPIDLGRLAAPKVKSLRRLYAQLPDAKTYVRIGIRQDALEVSKGMDEARLPMDLRAWIHELRASPDLWDHRLP
jgi:hypothetical protein